MDFQVGDNVVHCTHGLGRVLAIEERELNAKTMLYYMIEMADLTIWVPADENLNTRLRLPISEEGFKELLNILRGPAEPLPIDRRQRNLYLLDILRDGEAKSVCRVVRDLAAYRQSPSWSEYDSALQKRAEKALIGEWSFILSISPLDAQVELHSLLSHKGK